MYRFPSTVDVRSVASKGCVVTGDGLCGQIKPFHGETECVDSAHDCFKQAMSMVQKGSQIAIEMRDICTVQSLFCAECGMEDGAKCEDSEMGDSFELR